MSIHSHSRGTWNRRVRERTLNVLNKYAPGDSVMMRTYYTQYEVLAQRQRTMPTIGGSMDAFSPADERHSGFLIKPDGTFISKGF